VSLTIDEQQWNLNILRSSEDGAFRDIEIERLLRLHAPLRRLLMFAHEIARSEIRGALAGLEHLNKAAIVLDQDGNVKEMSVAARALMGRGLDVRGGKLTASDPASHAALDGLIGCALLGQVAETILIQSAYETSLMVQSIILKGACTDIFGQAGALLMITDPVGRASAPGALLRRLYGLTNRECAVAQALGAGDTVATIANDMGLRESTIRQITKSVLNKTDSRRQSELAAKLARLPPEAN
jgi:DNA-binding NarL/FixJ family response regulator